MVKLQFLDQCKMKVVWVTLTVIYLVLIQVYNY